jgi:hypothetical protein
MRAREILQENYNQSLESDLTNLLVGAKGSGMADINTADLVDQLYNMGYAVNINNILSLLDNNPVVMNATPEMVKLTPEENDIDSDNNEVDSAERVKDMAQKASEK